MSDPIRVLHFSSHDEDCGVGKYQENYLVGMDDIEGVHNKFFEVSPYQTRVMTADELKPVLEQLKQELKDYDILHIQHEFGLYRHEEFSKLVETAKQAHKKVVITVHLSPGFAIKPVSRGGLGPRSLIAYARKRRHYQNMVENHITPMQQADLVIAHNDVTIQSLKEFGVDPSKIKKLVHPVFNVPEPPKSTEIHDELHKENGDVVFAITGFLHRKKGILGAVRSLKYLPDNYKLALIGGIKSDSDEVKFQDKITDLVDELGLRDRVYITGFVPDDDRLNALMRECDVCVYPYDGVYYSNLSSGSFNLAFANSKPVIAYPTTTFKEVSADSNGAVVLCDTYAYYELARELKRIDIPKQIELSKAYAQKVDWAVMSKELVSVYKELV